MVSKTWNYTGKLASRRDHLTNALLGLVGEAGEVADLHKKWFFHSAKDGRMEQLRLELGDLLYYTIKLFDLYHLDLDEILHENEKKLKARYPDHFKRKKDANKQRSARNGRKRSR